MLQALPRLVQVQGYAKHWGGCGGGKKIERLSELLEWAGTHTLKGQLQYRLPAAGSKSTFGSILDLGEEYTFDPGKLASSFDLLSGANLGSGMPASE